MGGPPRESTGDQVVNRQHGSGMLQPTGKNLSSSPAPFTFTTSPSSNPTTQSASCSSAAECVPSTPSTRHPAALPAPTPEGASSTTTHSSGRNPSSSAPRRYGSGSGFPRSTISPLIIRSGTGSLAAPTPANSSRSVDEGTTAPR